MKPAAHPAHDRSSRAIRTLVIGTAAAAVLAVLQLTPLAPLPQRMNSFLFGVVAGAVVVSAVAWITRSGRERERGSGRGGGSQDPRAGP